MLGLNRLLTGNVRKRNHVGVIASLLSGQDLKNVGNSCHSKRGVGIKKIVENDTGLIPTIIVTIVEIDLLFVGGDKILNNQFCWVDHGLVLCIVVRTLAGSESDCA